MGGRGTRVEAGEDPQEPGTPKPGVLQYPLTGAWQPVTDPQPMKRPHSYCSCSTTPQALYSWLWALVLGSRLVGGVWPSWRATAACERLRRTCLGELVGLSGADSGACQSRLGSVMHWRDFSAS